MRQELTGLTVTVTSDKKREGSGYDGIHVEYEFRGRALSREKVERAVTLSEEKYCTVGGALRQATTITHQITIIDEE